MDKKIFANRLGLAISFVFLTVFPSASAWGQKAGGPQQVVVTNTAAQPIPMSGLVYVQNSAAQPVPVAIAGSEYFQVSKFGNSGTPIILAIPAGKTFIVEHVNIRIPNAATTDSYAATMTGTSGYGQPIAWLSLTKGSIRDADFGLQYVDWGGDTSMMMAAEQQLTVSVSGTAGATVDVLVSGHLIPTSF
ncbi:MAG TPA: hypothetical protein VF135_08990 [Terriglobales bacterium]